MTALDNHATVDWPGRFEFSVDHDLTSPWGWRVLHRGDNHALSAACEKPRKEGTTATSHEVVSSDISGVLRYPNWTEPFRRAQESITFGMEALYEMKRGFRLAILADRVPGTPL